MKRLLASGAPALPALSGALALAVGVLVWTPRIAGLLVASLLVHEMGHWWRIRREGLRPHGPYFLGPFGAFVVAWPPPRSAASMARIALAGPATGLVGGFVCWFAWKLGAGKIWRGGAYMSFWLNLINLIPILPLDGGRVVAALGRREATVGLLASPVILVTLHIYAVLALLVLLAPLAIWASKDYAPARLARVERRRALRGYAVITAALAAFTALTA